MNQGTFSGPGGFSKDFGKIVPGLEYENSDYVSISGDISRTFPAPEEYCKTWPAVTATNVIMPIVASSIAWDASRGRFIAIGCIVDNPGSFFTWSTDGKTWEPATLVATPSGGTDTIWVQIGANTSGRYVLLSEDKQESTGTLNLYYAYSDNGGASWTSGVGISNYIGSGTAFWYGTGPIQWDGVAFISAPDITAFTNGSNTPKPVRSTDGISWSIANTGLGASDAAHFFPVTVSATKMAMRHLDYPLLYTSTNSGSTWTATLNSLTPISYDPLSSMFYARTHRGFASSSDAVTWSNFQAADAYANSVGPITYTSYSSIAFTKDYALFLADGLHVSHKSHPLRKTHISLEALTYFTHTGLCGKPDGSIVLAYPGAQAVRRYYTSFDDIHRTAPSCAIINIDSSVMMLPHIFDLSAHYIKVR